MKTKYLLLMLSLAFVIFFAFQQDQKAKAFKTSYITQESMAREKDDTDNVQAIINKADELSTKWLNTLGNGNWLYLASKYETTEDVGADPETGLPLPNKSLWENWYALDADGRQTIYLLRRTDLERGNVDYTAWQHDVLYRLPSGVWVDTSQQGNVFQAFRPLSDNPCSSRLQTFLTPADNNIARKISEEILSNLNGEQWIVTMIIEHPPVSDVSGFSGSVFTGEEFVCRWDNQTGALEGFEQFLITEKGERVLLNRAYDFIAQWVDDIPAEMVDILQQLNSAEPKR